jgi:polyadenylate-binding protein 2
MNKAKGEEKSASTGSDDGGEDEQLYDEEGPYDEGGEEYYEGEEGEGEDGDEEEETLEEMQKRLESLDEELNKINKSQQEILSNIDAVNDTIDEKSVYVGQVDYAATEEELKEHFKSCGVISRVHIVTTKYKKPKGFAYIEFAEKDSVISALKYDGTSVFKDRTLTVVPKRINVPPAALRGFDGGRFGGRGGRFGRFGGRRPGGYGGYTSGYAPRGGGRFGARTGRGRFGGSFGGGRGGR